MSRKLLLYAYSSLLLPIIIGISSLHIEEKTITHFSPSSVQIVTVETAASIVLSKFKNNKIRHPYKRANSHPLKISGLPFSSLTNPTLNPQNQLLATPKSNTQSIDSSHDKTPPL